MAVPEENQTTLPADSNARPFFGLWDAVAGKFKAWRAVPGLGQAQVTVYDSTGAERGTAASPFAVEQASYTIVQNGELAGNAAATQMPNVPCKLIKFKAQYANVGRVYIGGAGVTVAAGTDDATTGIELSAGEETGWIPVDNANRFYRICNNAGDDLTYIALS